MTENKKSEQEQALSLFLVECEAYLEISKTLSKNKGISRDLSLKIVSMVMLGKRIGELSAAIFKSIEKPKESFFKRLFK